MKAQLININDHAELADRIGTAKADLAEARQVLANLQDVAVAQGLTHLTGSLFEVAISYDVPRTTVNYKKIATDMGASRQRIAANSKTTYSNRVSVHALKES